MSIAEKFLTMEYGPALEDHKESQHWLDRHGYASLTSSTEHGRFTAVTNISTRSIHRPAKS